MFVKFCPCQRLSHTLILAESIERLAEHEVTLHVNIYNHRCFYPLIQFKYHEKNEERPHIPNLF